MNKDVQRTEHNVVSDEQHVDENTSKDVDEVVYQEEIIDETGEHQTEDYPNYEEVAYVDSGQVVEGYSDDDGIVYYKYDDNYSGEIVYEEDSDVEYEEIVIDPENTEYEEVVYEDEYVESNAINNIEDVVYIEQEPESEEVILGDNGVDKNILETSDKTKTEKVKDDKVVDKSQSDVEKDVSDKTQLEKNKKETNKKEDSSDKTQSEIIKNDNGINEDSSSKNQQVDNKADTNVAKSVFTQEKKDSLVLDEASRSMGSANTGMVQGMPVVQLNNLNSSQNVNVPVQNNINQVAIPVVQGTSSYPVQGQVVAQQQTNMNQVAVPVAQGYPVQGQVAVQQQANMNQVAVPVAQGYPVQGQVAVQQQANMNQVAVPVAQGYSVQGQVTVQQQANMNQVAMPVAQPVISQPQIVSSVPVSGNYSVPTYQNVGTQQTYQTNGVQQVMGQANTPIMYQANSATYAARGVSQVPQNTYQNTGAAQVGSTNVYQTMIKPMSTTTKPASSDSDKSVYKKNHGFLKFLLLIFLVVLAVAVYFIYFRKSNYMGSANINSIFNPFKPIAIYKDDKAGYIDTKGEVLLEPIYDDAEEFYGGYAVVLSDGTYKIIDEEGTVVVTATSDDIPKYDVDYDVWVVDNALYDNEMQQLITNINDEGYGFYSYIDSSNSTVGVVNHKGETLHSSSGTAINVEVSKAYDNDAYALIHIADSDDVIVSGKTKSVIYTSAPNTIENEQDAVFSIGTKFLYFNEGTLLKEFDGVSDVNMFNYKKGILEISKDNSEYYFDTVNGIELQEANHDFSSSVEDEKYYGYEEVVCGDENARKYGLTKDEETIMACEYDSISFLDVEVHEFVKRRTLKELVILSKGDVVQLYDLTFKKVILELENVVYLANENSTFIVFTAKEGAVSSEDVVYSTLTGKTLSFTAGDKYFLPGSNYFVTIDKNNLATYYNIKMENIYEISNFLQE